MHRIMIKNRQILLTMMQVHMMKMKASQKNKMKINYQWLLSKVFYKLTFVVENCYTLFSVAPKTEEKSNEPATTTEANTTQAVQKPANQQVAIPKRKRRERIPERPNYRLIYI